MIKPKVQLNAANRDSHILQKQEALDLRLSNDVFN